MNVRPSVVALRSLSMPQKLFLAVAGTVLLTASAKVQIPFYPVPMTMQTFVVVLMGPLLGWRLAGATVLLYLLQGAAGLPVFAGTPERGIGLAYMTGPTGGYLAGFLAAALLTGALATRGWTARLGARIGVFALGIAAIYAPGLGWLGIATAWQVDVLAVGLAPFVLGEAVKVALATILIGALGRRPPPR